MGKILSGIAIGMTCSILTADINTGLQAHYPFNGNAKDISPNQYNASILEDNSEGITTTTNRFGHANSALRFDGTSGRVKTPLKRDDFSALTFSTWFKFEGEISDSYRALTGSETVGDGGNFFVGKNQSNSNIGVQDNEWVSNLATGTNAWDKNWHHLVYTFSNGKGRVYLDGTPVGSESNYTGTDGTIYIGMEPDSPTNYFKGVIDDVRYYDRALSSEDVTELYNLPDLNSGLVAHYNFNGSVNDSSGNDKNGTIQGTVSPTANRYGNGSSAMNFDGTSGVLTPLKREDYPEMSFATWFKYDGSVSDGYRALTGSNPESGKIDNFFVGKTNNNSNIGIQDKEWKPSVAVGTDAWDGKWHHLIYTYSGGSGTVYLDGASVGSTSGLTLTNGELYVGMEPAHPTNYFLGAMDDVRYYNRVLTSSEIALLYEPFHTLTTQAVSSITSNTATGNGTITDLGTGIVAHGFCWSTSPSPTINNSKTDEGAVTTTGSFTSTITGLTQSTTYYIRAYATDDSETVYGDELSFTTELYTPAIGLVVNQKEKELIWTVEEEVSVKQYQIINKNGHVLQTIIADGSNSYSLILENSEEVSLIVEDKSGFKQTFKPENGSIKTTVYDLSKGWNLIAITSENADLSKLGTIWYWNENAYRTVTKVSPTNAVWVYCAESKQISISGQRTDAVIELKTGWNMVGPTENCKLLEEADTIYSWNQTYDEISSKQKTLIEGIGYWIFSR